MSSVYVLEPPTAGKVVMSTSVGELDIELWPKEAPKAVRNFVQLCLEGYYHGTAFHRIIPGFMVQGGDPTGTGKGGESIYGAPFKDEFHSRLKFSHRGLVACASEGDTPHSNGSQFFFTLDRCDWLDKKHTIFGKITGDTIYNLLKFGDLEVNSDDRPVDPPKILSTEVLWNPFEDIVPRTLPGLKQAEEAAAKAAAARGTSVIAAQPKKKQLNLLSFGEEAEAEEAEDEAEAGAVRAKIRSSHDVLDDDPRLLKAAEAAAAAAQGVSERIRDHAGAAGRDVVGEKGPGKEDHAASAPGARTGDNPGRLDSFRSKLQRAEDGEEEEEEDDEAAFEARMRRQVLQKQQQVLQGKEGTGSGKGRAQDPLLAKLKATSKRPVVSFDVPAKALPAERDGSQERDTAPREGRQGGRSEDESEDESEGDGEGARKGVRASKLRLRKQGRKEPSAAEGDRAEEVDSGRQQQQQRLGLGGKKALSARQQQTLERLAKFQARLKQKEGAVDSSHSVSAATGEQEQGDRGRGGQGTGDGKMGEGRRERGLEGEEEDDFDLRAPGTWLKHKLHFAQGNKTKSQLDMERNNDPNQYVVHDPLLEKGKAKFNKMQAKAKKRGREWGGRSMD